MLKWTFFLLQNEILYALGFSTFVFHTVDLQLSFLLPSLSFPVCSHFLTLVFHILPS